MIKPLIKSKNQKTDYTIQMKQTIICTFALACMLTSGGHQRLCLAPLQGTQQTKAASAPIRVSGTVTDENNEPLIGVYVRVKGGDASAITDVDGHFYLDVPGRNSVMQFSYVGFKKQEITVGKEISFNVVMKEDKNELQELVVTGFASQKRLSVVGSIQTIQPSDLQVGSSRSLSNNLAGQLAGIIAVKPSGEPGYDDSNFWIRGISTFGSGSKPLVLIDGVERSLNDIDPAEIESFSVLKDASASAMYGVRGANGVIIINTKRGEVAKPSVNFRVEQSIQTPTRAQSGHVLQGPGAEDLYGLRP